MGKLGLLTGLVAGYVLGARAGKERYAQIKQVSSKVWHSGPVQKQVASAKETAKTKAGPALADMVADAARDTAEKLRAQRVISSELAEDARHGTFSSGPSTSRADRPDPWVQPPQTS
ncbi:MAG TPA: protoporphyrinogen oxidase [Phycicoccus sp.]|nr:protoporphyrinogen oxidase [Phycicoccus sp.]